MKKLFLVVAVMVSMIACDNKVNVNENANVMTDSTQVDSLMTDSVQVDSTQVLDVEDED